MYLSDRRGRGGNLAVKFLKNIVPILSYRSYRVGTCQLPVVTKSRK